MFERLDRDGDGFLTRGDWPRRGQRGGRPGGGPGPAGRSFPGPEEMERLDGDGDGALSFDEWRRLPELGKLDEERLRQMFRRLDRNDDHRLDPGDRPKRARHPGPPPPGAPGP